jgi:predicted acylesterase/phospholipase RssA
MARGYNRTGASMNRSKSPTRFFQTCLGVFQGGGCRGAAFAGAFAAARARNVGFAGVAGTSAGSIAAALVGAGASSESLMKSLKELNFVALLRNPIPVAQPPAGWRVRVVLKVAGMVKSDLRRAATVLKFRGMYSSEGIEQWLNDELKKLLPSAGSRVKFKHMTIPTYVVAADILTNDVKIWSSSDTPEEDVAFAVRCSCSIPGFFQPPDGRYMDGGILSNLPSFVFSGREFSQSQPLAKRILAFTLVSTRNDNAVPTSSKEFFDAMMSTIIDGASRLQERLVSPVHQIMIDTGSIQATDFDKMDDESINGLVSRGEEATNAFFDDELGRVQAAAQPPGLLSDEEEVYAAITEAADEVLTTNVMISDEKSWWAYKLFPTLLAWRMDGVPIRILLAACSSSDTHELYRRRLLRAMGAELNIAGTIPFRGFILNPDHATFARAIIRIAATPQNSNAAIRYRAPVDTSAISTLAMSILRMWRNDPHVRAVTPKIVSISEQVVLEKLRKHVGAYVKNDTQLSMETVPLESIFLMTKYVRGYKYKQIVQLFNRFYKASLRHFESAEVNYGDGFGTVVTPPVVEFTGGRYFIVQGNTRALYCYKNDIPELRCVTVRNAGMPLPSNQQISLKSVIIGGRNISTEDRFGGSIDPDFRDIEHATHIPDETLKDVQI